MDNTHFWFHLGCVMGSLAREDLAEYLAKNGFSMEQQKELNVQLVKLVELAYKPIEEQKNPVSTLNTFA